MSEALKILKDTELVRGGAAASGSGEAVKASTLEGKLLLLYFSAHWCPPCRRFTPALAELYTKLQADGKHDVECVFVSLDNDEAQFDEYVTEMPWLYVPYALNDERRDISQKYKARGIPHLVVCDADGSIITPDGTEKVQLDENGAKFPWRPEPFGAIWPETFLTVNESGQEVSVPSSTIREKHLMLYFSAHWCPPCRRFTPTLSAAYTEMSKTHGDKFELIFVSSDRDQAQYDEYRAEMSFPALAFPDREAKAALSKRYDVKGIPKLVILSPADAATGDRTLINDNVKGIIEAGDFSDFPFPKRNYSDIEEDGAEYLNDKRCLVVFHENGDDDEQEEVREAVRGAATALKDDTTAEDVNFYWSTNTRGVGDKVREIIKKSDVGGDALAVLLDIPDGGGFYVLEGAGKDATEAEHLVDFVRNPGERKQM